MSGVLTGEAIKEAVREGRISISDFNEEMVNAASYDLTLGSEVAVYSDVVDLSFYESYSLGTSEQLYVRPMTCSVKGVFSTGVIDCSKSLKVERFTIDESGWLLKPGIGYLMHTAERVTTNVYEPVLDGKSSTGRLFVTSHVTAGYGDPGFDGQYTLEVVATHPTIVYAGMRFCQMRFHTLEGPVTLYQNKGHYVGKEASGPIPSKSYLQFQK